RSSSGSSRPTRPWASSATPTRATSTRSRSRAHAASASRCLTRAERDVVIESVPNYSEGRRLDVVDRLAAAVSGTEGASLLDRTSDASHNRSVRTMAGDAPAVERAFEATIWVASEAIDMEQHTGEHPRIGAVDVIPFVPLGSTTLDACVVLARG